MLNLCWFARVIFVYLGHDTTASAFSWLMLAFAKNKECQEKARNEINKLLEDRDSKRIEW